MGKFADSRAEIRELFFSRNPDQQEISDIHIDRCFQVGIKTFSRWKPKKDSSGVANLITGQTAILLPTDFMSADLATLIWAATGVPQGNGSGGSSLLGLGVLSIFDSYLADTGYLPVLTGGNYVSAGGLTGWVGGVGAATVTLTGNSDGRWVLETGVAQTETTTRAIKYTAMHTLTDTVYTIPDLYKDCFLLFVLHYIYKGLASDSLMKTGSKRTQEYSDKWNKLAVEALKEAKQQSSPLGFLL